MRKKRKYMKYLFTKENMSMEKKHIERHSLLLTTQFSSVTQSSPTLWDLMDCSTLGFPIHHQLLELIQTHVFWVSDTVQQSYSLLSLSPSFNLSQNEGCFQWVSSSNQVVKVLEFQLLRQFFQWIFSISPFSEYSGLISLRVDCLDLLAVQGTLKSLLQHHSSKPSILQCSAFFIVQLSYLYMNTGITIPLTRWTLWAK